MCENARRYGVSEQFTKVGFCCFSLSFCPLSGQIADKKHSTYPCTYSYFTDVQIKSADKIALNINSLLNEYYYRTTVLWSTAVSFLQIKRLFLTVACAFTLKLISCCGTMHIPLKYPIGQLQSSEIKPIPVDKSESVCTFKGESSRTNKAHT